MLKLTVVVLLVYISWFGNDMVNALSTRLVINTADKSFYARNINQQTKKAETSVPSVLNQMVFELYDNH